MNKIKMLLLFLFCNLINGQSKNIEQKIKRNSISIEFYKPIENSLPEFYDFNYGFGYSLDGVNNYSKSKFSNAFGISYERICKNNIIFRPRIGLSIIENNENQVSEELVGNPAKYYSEYTYKQNHLNIFIGIAKRIDLTKKITLDLGLDLASIYYSKGKGNYNSTKSITDLITGSIEKQDINRISEMGEVYSFGIGPYIKPEVVLFENFTLSLEIQMYFLKTMSNSKSYKIEISDQFINEMNFEHIELEAIVYNDYNFCEWTKISPLLRLGYKF
jgi:hypothetical protein